MSRMSSPTRSRSKTGVDTNGLKKRDEKDRPVVKLRAGTAKSEAPTLHCQPSAPRNDPEALEAEKGTPFGPKSGSTSSPSISRTVKSSPSTSTSVSAPHSSLLSSKPVNRSSSPCSDQVLTEVGKKEPPSLPKSGSLPSISRGHKDSSASERKGSPLKKNEIRARKEEVASKSLSKSVSISVSDGPAVEQNSASKLKPSEATRMQRSNSSSGLKSSKIIQGFSSVSCNPSPPSAEERGIKSARMRGETISSTRDYSKSFLISPREGLKKQKESANEKDRFPTKDDQLIKQSVGEAGTITTSGNATPAHVPPVSSLLTQSSLHCPADQPKKMILNSMRGRRGRPRHGSFVFGGVILIAIKSFKSEEFEFNEGDMLSYLERDDNSWVRAELDSGQSGWFPRSCVELAPIGPLNKSPFENDPPLSSPEILTDDKESSQKTVDRFLTARPTSEFLEERALMSLITFSFSFFNSLYPRILTFDHSRCCCCCCDVGSPS